MARLAKHISILLNLCFLWDVSAQPEFCGRRAPQPGLVDCQTHSDCVGWTGPGTRPPFRPCCLSIDCVCGSTRDQIIPGVLRCGRFACVNDAECAPGRCVNGVCDFSFLIGDDESKGTGQSMGKGKGSAKGSMAESGKGSAKGSMAESGKGSVKGSMAESGKGSAKGSMTESGKGSVKGSSSKGKGSSSKRRI